MNISYNPTPANNLIQRTTELIHHFNEGNPLNIIEEEMIQYGQGKSTKNSKKKLIDTLKKIDLEKIAKENNISLKTKQGKIKTKEQLFNSLKRKKLI
jgi:hypothetical protein